MGDRTHGIDPKRLSEYAQDIKEIVALGCRSCCCHREEETYLGALQLPVMVWIAYKAIIMGMLATCINGNGTAKVLSKMQKYPPDYKPPSKLKRLQNPISSDVLYVTWRKERVVIFWSRYGKSIFYDRLGSSLTCN